MAKRSVPVLLDVDGVLADNTSFEEKVTGYIVCEIAAQLGVSVEKAVTVWQCSLSAARDTPLWFDYDYHCTSIGVRPLAREAHRKAAPYLRRTRGASATWSCLLRTGFDLSVASDAVPWVVEFKLAHLGFEGHKSVISGFDLSATKSNVSFWQHVAEMYENATKVYVVDNRVENLVAARRACARFHPLLFPNHEHVTLLGKELSPTESGCQGPLAGQIVWVDGHQDLIRLIREDSQCV